jgi:hypothetical protein
MPVGVFLFNLVCCRDGCLYERSMLRPYLVFATEHL